jgi:retron-type reverse transcriptase
MMAHSLYPELQSSYRQYHSTETALLEVTNDILRKMNSQEVTLLVTLDLSSAFESVNHEILPRRLRNEFGIHGKVLDWFKYYLHNRGQQISIEGTLSQRFALDSGVPQGSCLGPLLFIIYVSKLFKIIEDQLPDLCRRHTALPQF